MNTAEENNKLIAEFMEHKPTFEVYIDDVLTTLERPVKNYNSDWNWLMEVVEKIESLGYYVNITGTYVSIGAIESKTNPIFIEKDSNIKIEAVYNACVEFIKWYNSHLCSNCGRFDDVVGTHNIDTCEECALNS